MAHTPFVLKETHTQIKQLVIFTVLLDAVVVLLDYVAVESGQH